MRQILSPDGRRAVNAVIAFLAIATFLYLFVYPALVATGVIELYAATFAIGVSLTMLFWLVIANGAYSAAAEIYHFHRKSLLPDTLVLRRLFERYGHRSTDRLHAPVVIGLISYFLVIYEYAISYTLLSRLDAHAFNIGTLTLFDAIYFSLTTAATVGYGDIVPVDRWKLLGPITAMNGALMFGWSTAVIFEVLRKTMERGAANSAP